MSHATTLVSDEESTASEKKKYRKRGHKGGKKVQEKRTNKQDRGLKCDSWRVVVVVAALAVGVFVHLVVRMMGSVAA